MNPEETNEAGSLPETSSAPAPKVKKTKEAKPKAKKTPVKKDPAKPLKDGKKAPAKKDAPKAKKVEKKAPKARAESTGKAGRPSQFAGKKIHKLISGNPRREGSLGFQSFALIREGMSYEKYIEAGGRAQDLNYGIAHKHVSIVK